jgi:hypothetical protein
MADKTVQIKVLVTQTIERTYKLVVPKEESLDDLKERAESGCIGPEHLVSEGELQDVSVKIVSVRDLDAERLKKEREQAVLDEIDTIASGDSVGRLA